MSALNEQQSRISTMKGNARVLASLFFMCIFSSSSVSALLPPIAPPLEHNNTALAAALDGTIYAVDTDSRKVLWSFQIGEIYSSYQAPSYHDGGDTDASDHYRFYLDCGEDWGLYVHGPSYEGGAKLATGAEEFFEQTPMVTAESGVLTGSRKYTVFLLDVKSERLIHAFDSEHSTILSQTFKERKILRRKNIEDSMASIHVDFEDIDELLFVFRTDYLFKHISPETKEELWYLKFAEIKASFLCPEAGNVGEFSTDAENGFDRQLDRNGHLSNDCQRTVNVYRIRDRSKTESAILSHIPQNPHSVGNEAVAMSTKAPGDLHLAGKTESSQRYNFSYVLGLGGAILAAFFVHLVLTLLKKSGLMGILQLIC